MVKLLLILEVPSISCRFVVYMPDFLPVKELVPLRVKAASEMSGGLYVSSGHEFLCVKGEDILLDEDASLSMYDIGNGDHLVMM